MPKLSHSGSTRMPCGTIVKTMDYEVQLKRIKNVIVVVSKPDSRQRRLGFKRERLLRMIFT